MSKIYYRVGIIKSQAQTHCCHEVLFTDLSRLWKRLRSLQSRHYKLRNWLDNHPRISVDSYTKRCDLIFKLEDEMDEIMSTIDSLV